MTLTLTLPSGEKVYTGRQVTFQAPCESEGLTGLIVDGVTYDLVSSLGAQLVGNSFDMGAMVSVIFNLETKKAYVQNADTNAYLEERFGNHTHSASAITGGIMGGLVVANATAVANIGTKQIRNIYAGTEDLTEGVSALPAGDIYIVYE